MFRSIQIHLSSLKYYDDKFFQKSMATWLKKVKRMSEVKKGMPEVRKGIPKGAIPKTRKSQTMKVLQPKVILIHIFSYDFDN